MLLWSDTFGCGHLLCYHLLCPTLILDWRCDNHDSDRRQQTWGKQFVLSDENSWCHFTGSQSHCPVSLMRYGSRFKIYSLISWMDYWSCLPGNSVKQSQRDAKQLQRLFSVHTWICYSAKKTKFFRQIIILKVNHRSNLGALTKISL